MTQPTEHPIDRLARSLFGFALLAFLVAFIAWGGLLLSPASPEPLFERLRLGIIVGMGALVLGLLLATGWLFRAPDAALRSIAAGLHRLLGRAPAALVAGILLLQLNLVLGPALRDVAPAIVGPMRFLLAGWSVTIATLLLTLHWDMLRAFFRRTAATWAGVGFSVVLLLLVGGLFTATSLLVQSSGLNDWLRGGLDYRDLEFIDDGQMPPSAVFWQEQSRTRVRWQPYVYWVVAAFDGQYIHVGADGLRRTVNPDSLPAGAPLVAVFGGSTAWGEGARDAFTIPSQLSTLLNEGGQPARVVSYAQTGYVSMQDLLTFQLLLARGDVPDVAVFYGGFNDLLSAYDQGIAGLPMQEAQRLADSEAGRSLRSGLPVLRPFSASLAGIDTSLVAAAGADAATIVDRYLANARLAHQLAQANGVEVLFVWQPSIVFKDNLVRGERGAHDTMMAQRPGFRALYRAAHDLLMQRLAESDDLPDFLILHDLFNGDERAIFYDLIHITEKGNTRVAERIAAALAPLLRP